jgi:hypothetical protein
MKPVGKQPHPSHPCPIHFALFAKWVGKQQLGYIRPGTGLGAQLHPPPQARNAGAIW